MLRHPEMPAGTPTREYCPRCGWEYVVFPDGEDERALVALLGRGVCIDCAEGLPNWADQAP
jgi:hypothetical protein